MRFDQADVVEEKFVAAGSAELAAFFEQDANFRCGAIVVVGQDLDDDRHLVRRVALENDMLHDEFVGANARAFLMARSITSRVTLALRALSITAASRGFASGSAPPSFAATIISFTSFPTS